MEKYVVGIDIGGQSTKLGIVDARGNILCQSVISSLQTRLDDFLDDLTRALEELIAKAGGKELIRGIGVGAPNGNYYKSSIEFAPNLKWGYDDSGNPMIIQLGKILSDRIGVPVAVTNDANAAAQGEMTYGVARGMKNFIMITLGTGVGSGIVINGQVLYGHDGFAGELGHTIAVRGGRPCNCGRVGCLETYTSAIGVARTAREFLANSEAPSLLRELDPERISSKDIYEAAEKGDALAVEIFEYTGKILGQSLADFVAFSAPEAIVLFGGLTKARKYIEEPILRHMNDNLLNIWKNKIRMEFSQLKDSDAAILGASALAWEL